MTGDFDSVFGLDSNSNAPFLCITSLHFNFNFNFKTVEKKSNVVTGDSRASITG